MHIIRKAGALITILVVFGVGCQKAKAPGEPFVAQVGEAIITAADLTRELQKRPKATPEQREAILQEMIRTEALLAKARASGFDKDPVMAQRVKQLVATAYLEKLQGPEKSPPPAVSDLQEYFAAHAHEFGVAERVHIAGILLRVPQKATEEKKQEFQQRAEGILAKAQATQTSAASFAALAREYSEDQATRYQGGDIGWLTRAEAESRWSKEMADAVFALKQPHDLSRVIPGVGGLYIFKLIERQAPRVKSIDEVKDLVAYRFGREQEAKATRALEEQVRSGLKIEINRPLVEQLSATAINAPATPPAMPGP